MGIIAVKSDSVMKKRIIVLKQFETESNLSCDHEGNDALYQTIYG